MHGPFFLAGKGGGFADLSPACSIGQTGKAFLLTLALFALFPACTRKEAIPPGALVIALETAPKTLDPRFATSAASSKVRDLLYNGLLRRNDDFSLSGDLAASYEIFSSTEYRFTLREGLRFHDGQKVTASDVKALYAFILDPANKSPHRGPLAVIEKIETPSDREIVFHLKEPSAPFLGALTLGIVPARFASSDGAPPPGTGPFVFESLVEGEKIALKKFDAYHESPAFMERVVFKIIPDETVRTLELESGACHLITNPITPDLLPRLRANRSLKVLTAPGANYSYLGFNLDDPIVGDRKIRRALAHAIDREGVIRHILKNLATLAEGPFASMNRFAASSLPSYPYDPVKAARLLDEAGYLDPDGDGPDVRFTLEYSTSQNELRKRIAEIFQWQLARIGVGLVIRSYEWGTFYGAIKEGRFQMFSLTWVGIADPDILHYIFHSSSLPPEGANRGRYRNKEIDRLLEKGRTTTGSDRKAVYEKAQHILAKELPYVSLWHSVNVAVADRRLDGFVVAPDENLRSIRTSRLVDDKVAKP